jgi:aryl-alcohol dehydrogenase-like predicted oxidoreductase
MRYRTLGRTGLSVSEIGFGAWGIGGELWQGATDSESLAALHKAADLGVNFIDTALAYGKGHSEQLVGRFIKERREKIVVASKIPPMNDSWPARPGSRLSEVFPYKYIVECTERSLRNLGVGTLDIQQLHVWLDDWTDLPEWFEAVSELKEQGKIRFFGISINDHQPESALRVASSGKVDTFQVIYNIFDQSPADELFPLCSAMGIGVIVRVPFDEGALTGSITPSTVFPRGDFRVNYFRGDRKKEVQDHVEKLRPLLGKEAATLPELALRFCLNSTAVSTVIPGMRTTRHAEENCPVSDGRHLSPGLAKQLRAHRWDKNFYGDPSD